jgi:L-ascorbate metabolism protein UlaG (beta-lactamase superfamily)
MLQLRALLLCVLLLAYCAKHDDAQHQVASNSTFFNGQHFHNLSPSRPKTFWDVIKWQISRDSPEWPTWHRNSHFLLPPLLVRDKHKVLVTFINHATVLLQYDHINVLTDPIWSDRASPVSWAGPKRVRAPGLPLSSLPPIHVVLLSHNHYDHMDVHTLQLLHKRFHPYFLVGLGNQAFLRKQGLSKVIELAWWQSFSLKKHRFIFVPAQHFSGRGLFDRNKSLWGGYILSTALGSIYFAGDTAWGKHFALIHKRYAPIIFSMLPIGAYLPRTFMRSSHLSPREAVQALQAVHSRFAIGIHFDTFASLSDDPFQQAPLALKKALDHAGIDHDRFRALGFGQSCWVTATQMQCPR